MKATEPTLSGLAFPRPPARSRRARLVARWFRLDMAPTATAAPIAMQPNITDLMRRLTPDAGRIVLISGPSGSGKSVLLGAIQRIAGARQAIDLNTVLLPDRPLVDCFGKLSLHRSLRLLSRVGLAEAWTYLRTPAELSEGQRWRLRLALALHQARCRQSLILCDEFAAVLDRVTATVAARALRRVVSAMRIGAIVATSHNDLVEALEPDTHVHCDFGRMRIEQISSGMSATERSGRESQK